MCLITFIVYAIVEFDCRNNNNIVHNPYLYRRVNKKILVRRNSLLLLRNSYV